MLTSDKKSYKPVSERISQISLQKECVKLFCLLYWGPGTESCNTLLNGSWFEPIEALNQDHENMLFPTLDNVKQTLSGYSNPETLFQDLEETYVRLFINNKDGIKSPLYHSCYWLDGDIGKGTLMGEPAIEMQHRFEAVGLSLNDTINEPPDHLSLELEYLYYLLDGVIDHDRMEYVEEARQFVSLFMLPWVTEFFERMNEDHQDHFYSSMTSLLISLLGNIAGGDTN